MASSTLNDFCVRLCDSIAKQWSASVADRCILTVGLSGGLDSMVLLHALTQLRNLLPLQLSAIHVHHGLSSHADEWAAFCQRVCAAWSVPLRQVKVTVNANGDGVEAAARKVRYQAYVECGAEVVALAHHRDDQIETFFLGALRGGGLRSLAAMPNVRVLTEHTILWRPLLPFSREQLQHYAEAMQLEHIEDDSNHNCVYLRNWLRLDGLPYWRAHLPYLDNQVEAAVGRLQDELALLDEVAEADWALLHAQKQEFDIPLWRTLSAARRRQQLRLFAQKNGLGLSTSASLIEFARQLMESKNGAQWCLPHACVIYYDFRLWIDKKHASAQLPWFDLLPMSCGQLMMVGYLKWQCHNFGLAEITEEWTVRQADALDTIVLKGGRKKVKKLLQERKIPPFMRAVWPVLCDADNHCIAVINVAVAADIGVADGWMPLVQDLPVML